MSDHNTPTNIWSGRFNEPTDAFVQAFTASVEFDQRLYKYDIQGSIAHASMLAAQGIITAAERDAIVLGLEQIRAQIEQGKFSWSIELEDVHMNVEAALTEAIGSAGKKLHTGRSRNDQVATDIRLWLRDEIDNIGAAILRLQTALLNLAEQEAETILPGFTHLQTAQPVTFGHHMMAWFEMLERDRERFNDCNKRVNVMPLGAAALAGTTYPIDRQLTARLLGFDRPTENSLDSVSDRDFAIEFSAASSILMMHLSRFSEELIIWSSAQFGFIELSDSFCTGSSIMPQKKNPDVPELIRGKTGRIFGHLIGLLTLMKGQPLAYNKDNQEDKEPLFDTVDNIKGSLKVFADMIPAITCRRQNMREAAMLGFATATDLADYLVRRGIPFRDAHEVVGQAVAFGVKQKRDLSQMTLDELQQFSKSIEQDVFEVLTLEGSVAARNHIGGTAPSQVRSAIERARLKLQALHTMTRLHHVSLIVADTEKSLGFYRDLLCLEVSDSRPDLGYPGAWLQLAKAQIHLLELPNPDPLEQRPEHGGRDRHLALEVDNFSELKDRLDAHGIAYTTSRSGRQALFCRDPDQNAIEIIARKA